ncbi:S41 family peptidase [Roseivirga sp. UBA838]|uniref:S41 family peptidase n=1 Tax=Roseivirga sp. UBA838 TaxID=1947393 RepID=UPI00257DC191|nr:S41 family peptidase [Roseivirga sp. UBA838]|tara:strand:- start:53364 stop:56486 length:3123 start_codon:yes stop_codon:yes gene_type:complete
MIKSTLFSLCLLIAFSIQAQQDVYFASTPALTPDGSQIVFSYDSDLWKVSSSGGTATRLTGMDGVEEYPRISPDGRWIAFSSNQYGNADIYLMPIDGGEIRQLTYNSANDEVETWSWDSQTIYFRSGRYNRTAAYTVSVQGGTPKRLFEHYFNWPHNLAIHPDGRVFFNESWESSNQVHRKRYKGAFNPDIKTYNTKTGTYEELTDYEGKDMWSSIDKNGNIYFASDESNGQYNLYGFVNGTKTRLTNFNTSIKNPQVNANGGFVVFEKDYQIHVYDVSRKRSQKVDISVFKNNTLAQEQEFSTDGNISEFDVSQDEKKLAFVSRGELFVSDISGKFVKQLKTKPEERVVEVKWLKDNKTLLYTQTVGGYTNLFTIDAATGTGEKQLTFDKGSNRNLELNPDLTKAAYYSGIREVRLLDLETLKSETVANEELWGLYNPQPRFSPDGRYLTFTVRNDFEEDIYIYSLETQTTHNYTKTGVPETSPFWGPEGKYIYFVSNRTEPSYPFGMRDARIYRVPLVRHERDFKSDELAKVFEEKKEEKTTDNDDSKPQTAIDFEANVLREMEQIGPYFGSQSSPYVVKSGNKTHIIYRSNHDEARNALWVTTLEPFERPNTEKINGSASAGGIIQVKKNLYLNNGGQIAKLNLSNQKITPIDIKFDFRRSLQSEFKQMYYETWAGIEQNFYNETFHGEDWSKLKDQYARFLPHLNSRTELRTLLNDLLGELNSSHMGFNSFGRDERTYYRTSSLNLGLLFSNDNPYEVAHIVAEGPADFPDKNIRPGDLITAINGETIDPGMNREYYLAKPSIDEEVHLTLNRNGNTIEVKIHPNSTGSLRSNLYDEWIAGNQKVVDSKTDKKVAYVHMKNMSGGSLQEFLIEMTSEAYNRDALILDLRYNTGGNVHDEVLKFLSQKPYLQWKFREGKLTPQGNFGAGAKPMVLLINEQSLSDAEMTATGFKELGLGTIIGTETYRWIIFTSGAGLVDGSSYRLPSWGCYTLDGKNIEQVGVQPDIYVRTTFEDRVKGRDPQLEKAIEEVLKQLKN